MRRYVNGYEILRREETCWSKDKQEFGVDSKEIKILIDDGAQVVEKDKDNGDGTFFSSVTFGGRTFSASSREKVFV